MRTNCKKILALLFFFPFVINFNHAKTDLLPDIIVADSTTHLVINIPNVRMYLYQNGAFVKSYPITVGKNISKTPPGDYKIGRRTHNPTWHIPASIRKERQQKGLPDIDVIPPGPNNPLGPLFIRFGENSLGLGIHGTNAPSSIPGIRSHGCVRMRNKDVLEINELIEEDDLVTVSYQLYGLNVDEANQLWLQKYSNPYKHSDTDLEKIKQTIELWQQNNIDEPQQINEEVLRKALTKVSKKIICLTCDEKNPSIVGTLQSLAWTDQLDLIRLPDHSRPIENILIYDSLNNPLIFRPLQSY